MLKYLFILYQKIKKNKVVHKFTLYLEDDLW